MTLKVALIGLGTISKVHVPILKNNKNVEIVSTSDINENKSLRNIKNYVNYREMLEKEKIDIAHIMLPHNLHVEVTKECVKHGINVILEKPVGISYNEVKNLEKFLRDYPNIKVGVCLQNRLNNTTIKILDIIKSNKLGNLLGIKGDVTWHRNSDYYKEASWRGKISEAGSGVLINQAIHTIDLMSLIAGNATSVKGGIDKIMHEDIEVEDFAYANIKYENNINGLLMCTVANTVNSSVYIVVYFEKGKLIIKNNKLYINEYSKNDLIEVICEDSKLEGSKCYYGSSHKKYIDNFIECVVNDKYNYTNVKDSLEVHRIIDAIKESSKNKKRINIKDGRIKCKN